MKTQYLGSLIGALAMAASMSAQTINNGQEVAGLFQMDITIPGAAGPGWFLQQTGVLPTLPAAWVTIAGPFGPGPTFSFLDVGSGAAPQRYYRLVNLVPPVVPADCGVNRYGFIRRTVTPGFCMYGDPLAADLGNGLPNLMPVMPYLTEFFQYSGGWNYDIQDIFWPGWDFGTATLNPGQGCFINNPGPATPVTFIGQVQEGALVVPLAAGFNMVSSMVPQAGLLTTDLGYTPAALDVVYRFVCGSGFTVHTFDPDLGGWDPSEPFIGVAESFWILRNAPGAWVRIFNACP